jgi:hypothetical protein
MSGMRSPALGRRGLLAGAAGLATLGFLPAAAQEADRLPYNGRLFGWPIPTDSTRSARWMYGRRLAARLRADRSGVVTSLVWRLRIARANEPEGRYSARGGGYVHIEMRKARPEGYPTQAWPDLGPRGLLARTAPNNGLEAELESLGEDGGAIWQDWPLDPPVTVEAGALYHVLFVPHESRAWGAVNCGGQDAPPPLGSGLFGGPYYGDDFAVLRETDAGSETFENLAIGGGPTIAGILMRYADGMLVGPPVFGTWRSAHRSLGGRYVARQRFVVPERDLMADGIWIRAWTESRARSELIIDLHRAEDDGEIESIAVPSSRLPKGPPRPGGPPITMVHLPFAGQHRLSRGSTYELCLRSRLRGYATAAVRQLGADEVFDIEAMRDRIDPGLAQADISDDGGTTWRRWQISEEGDPQDDMALPIAFTLVG